MDDARSFSEVTDVGGVICDSVSINAASYYAGYVASKLAAFHLQNFKTTLNACEHCSNILGQIDYNIHLFTTFKEYHSNGNRTWGLKYCSQQFLQIIQEYERVFLYCFSKYAHIDRFCSFVNSTITYNCHHPKFCKPAMNSYFIKFYVQCRTLQAIKIRNKTFRIPVHYDKCKKLSNK